MATRGGDIAVWSSEVVIVIAAELLIGLAALGVSLFLSARNRNFISS
jgi:hypothetical protein